jgi:hypothetical protein
VENVFKEEAQILFNRVNRRERPVFEKGVRAIPLEVRCQVLTFDIKQGSYKILRGSGAETLPIFLLPIHSR